MRDALRSVLIVLFLLALSAGTNVWLVVKIDRMEKAQRDAPKLRDGIFVETNGLIWHVDYGYPRGVAAGATNLVVKTVQGFTITAEFKPFIPKP